MRSHLIVFFESFYDKSASDRVQEYVWRNKTVSISILVPNLTNSDSADLKGTIQLFRNRLSDAHYPRTWMTKQISIKSRSVRLSIVTVHFNDISALNTTLDSLRLLIGQPEAEWPKKGSIPCFWAETNSTMQCKTVKNTITAKSLKTTCTPAVSPPEQSWPMMLL